MQLLPREYRRQIQVRRPAGQTGKAAVRHGRKTVIIPAANAAELARVPELAAQLDIRPVHTLDEAIAVAFVIP